MIVLGGGKKVKKTIELDLETITYQRKDEGEEAKGEDKKKTPSVFVFGKKPPNPQKTI